MPADVQVMDMTVVSCDGNIALVDFEVIGSDGVKTVRAEYHHHPKHPVMRVLSPAITPEGSFVAQCPRCLADVREVVLVQREDNQGKN